MQMLIKLSVLFLVLLSACNLPQAESVTTPVPEEEYDYTQCGYAWAREPLEALSEEFDSALKAAEPGASGHAEAYGENCLNNQGGVVRFLAMETDFYVTLKVEQLQDREALGNLLEQVLSVVAQFPVDETPGPQPGYVGVTFEAPADELRLWFPQREAEAALEKGLHGVELLEALQAK